MLNLEHRLVDRPDKYVTEAFEPFKSRLRANWTKGFQALMKYDAFSVRGFMMSHGITPLYVQRSYFYPQASDRLHELAETITTPFNGSRHSLSMSYPHLAFLIRDAYTGT